MAEWRAQLLDPRECRKHLLLDPKTKQPYAYWGLFAPLATFRRLGQDAIVYMRMLQECLAVAIISTLIYAWPMANNRRTARAAGMSIWGGGAAIGSAEQLTWEHVVCDILVILLFSAFVHRQQRLTVVFDKAGEIRRDALQPVAPRASSITRTRRRLVTWMRRRSGAIAPHFPTKRSGHSDGLFMSNSPSCGSGGSTSGASSSSSGGSSRSGSRPTSVKLPPLDVSGSKESSVHGSLGDAVGGACLSSAPSQATCFMSPLSPHPSRRVAFDAAELGGSEAVHAPAQSPHVSVSVRPASTTSSRGSGDSSVIGQRRQACQRGRLFRSFRAHGTFHTIANVGEACSVVVWGWSNAVQLPHAILAAIASAAGSWPVAVSQPPPSAERTKVLADLHSAIVRRQWLVEKLARLRKRCPSPESTSPASAEERRQRRTSHISQSAAEVALNALSSARSVARIWTKAGRLIDPHGGSRYAWLSLRRHGRSRDPEKMISHNEESLKNLDMRVRTLSVRFMALANEPRELLPLAFITFASVDNARKVITRFRQASLWPRTLSELHPNLRLGPAPNPSDIRWEHLEVPAARRTQKIRNGYCYMAILLPLSGFLIMFATYSNVVLYAYPFFTHCTPREGLTCDDTLIQDILTNFGHWVWTTLLIVGAFQLVIQPTLWLATDGGPCCKSAREYTTSYTESCLHLMLRVLAFQMIAALLCALAFIPVAGWEQTFFGYKFNLDSLNCTAYDAPGGNGTAVAGAVWVSRLSRCWYELGGSVISNTIIADATLINLVIDGIFKPDYYVQRLQARYSPTQEMMDEACRLTNVLYLPFRAQLLVKAVRTCYPATALPILPPPVRAKTLTWRGFEVARRCASPSSFARGCQSSSRFSSSSASPLW